MAPSPSASRRRASPGSTTTTGPIPRATRAAIVSAPMGPAPKTIAESPAVIPERVMPCRATARGSASAAARGDIPSGRGSSERASHNT